MVKPVFEAQPDPDPGRVRSLRQEADNDDALCRGYLEVIRLIGFIVVPMMAALAVVAPVFVPVVLGDQSGASRSSSCRSWPSSASRAL